MTRLLSGLCIALTAAIVVLSFLLHRATQKERATAQQLAIREAVAQRAVAEASRVIADLNAEREAVSALQVQVNSLSHALDSITINRPIYATRPRPTTAREYRDAILRAVHQ
jgi:hypothetical protein